VKRKELENQVQMRRGAEAVRGESTTECLNGRASISGEAGDGNREVGGRQRGEGAGEAKGVCKEFCRLQAEKRESKQGEGRKGPRAPAPTMPGGRIRLAVGGLGKEKREERRGKVGDIFCGVEAHCGG